MIGPLLSQFAMARFCRMLGTLLNAGVPLVQALNVARKSIGNQILVDAVSNSIDRVKEGAQLGASLADCRNLFPGSVLEMISVGEESGKLDAELVRIAVVTEGDLDRNLKTAVALAEPAMLFFIAAFIGTIFIGMLFPIFPCRITSNNKPRNLYENNEPKPNRAGAPCASGLHAGGTVAGHDHSGDSGRHRPAQDGRPHRAGPQLPPPRPQISSFGTALGVYEVDNGRYPEGATACRP